MARLDLTNKTAAAAATSTIKTAGTKKLFTFDDIAKFTSKEMVDVINHKAGTVWMITGKGYGKNRATALAQIAWLETDYSAQGLMFKKYKTNAMDRLHESIANMALEIKLAGYHVPDYEKGINQTYRMVKKDKTSNQMVSYQSFEDYNQVAGIEAKNLGFFPMVVFDEPVMLDDDPDKIPTEEEWDTNILTLMDSVGRSNDRHAAVKGREIAATKYYYTMNPWDDHPIISKAEAYFPEDKFREYFEKDIIDNHTLMMYVPEIDTLIVRGTKFGNKIINIMEKTMRDLDIIDLNTFAANAEKIDFDADIYKDNKITRGTFERHLKKHIKSLYSLAMDALARNDKKQLATILGLKYEKEDSVKKTYNLENLKLADTDIILKNSSDCSTQFLGWDIDQRKGGRFILTPVTVVWKRKGNFDDVKNIVIGKQFELPSTGMGNLGERLKFYGDTLSDITDKYDKRHKELTRNHYPSTVAVDDNQRHFISMMSTNLPELKWFPTKFKTKESWRIQKREVWLQAAIDSGIIIMDKDNKGLISDLSKSYARQGADQRYEGGGQADIYDRINSMEYALYFVRGELRNDIPAGDVQDYLGDENDKRTT